MLKTIVNNPNRTPALQQQSLITLKCLMHKARATKLALAKYGIR